MSILMGYGIGLVTAAILVVVLGASPIILLISGILCIGLGLIFQNGK